ncbi:GlpC Fe-S oxidoreductase [Fimbriimonadaceae bacterium]
MKELSALTSQCIRCGFCLEACPTFTETASELESPRGRIYLVRSALDGKLNWQDDVKPHLDRCLGCRACETACPSGVEYGNILELARDAIEGQRPNRPRQALLKVATDPGLMRLQAKLSTFLPGHRIPNFVSRFVSGVDAEVDKPQLPSDWHVAPLLAKHVPPVRGEVYLLEGCAMRVLFPRVHLATRRLLRRVGYQVREVKAGCCGAMHAHNGGLDEARERARDLIQAMPDDLPVIVNSAGCGSTMKEYGELLGPEGVSFAKRVRDVSEFFLAEGLAKKLMDSPGLTNRTTYHDACHLAHGQKIWEAPRKLLAAVPGLDLVPLAEADTCCGSAGIYNVTQPKLARQLLDRKMRHIEETEAEIVVLGNPGCHAWIAQGCYESARKPVVLHLAEMLEASFIGLDALSN